MAIHEVSAGLAASAGIDELGVPVSATLAASTDASAATLQVLELTASIDASAGIVAQRGNQNLAVSGPLIDGELTDVDERLQDTNHYRVVGLQNPILEGRRNEALNAPGVPLRAAAHPDPAMPGIQVISRSVAFEQGDQTRAIVRVTWGPPTGDDLAKSGGASGGGVLTLSPASYTESVWRDKDGQLMVVNYQGVVAQFSRAVEAELQKKTWTATLTREFSSPQYVDMLRPSALNSAQFGVFAPRQLLFLGPTINETDEGNYSHGYQMTFNPDTWKLRASIWVSGAIPEDATENFNPPSEPGGLKVFQVDSEFDFNTLPVWFP